MVAKDQGAQFGEQMSALANGWKQRFGGEDSPFFYTIPNKSLAPKVTHPESIQGRAKGVEITSWSDSATLEKLLGQVAP